MSTRATPDWKHYYAVTASRRPRELLRAALRLLDVATPAEHLAVDIGCGAGVETLELLRQGWAVLAVDRSRSAIQHLRSAVPVERVHRLRTRVARVESLRLPSADFVWAGVSLPFLDPKALPAVWQEIVACLKPGGLFAGDFFGLRHGWAGAEGMNFHSATAIRQLLRPLVLETLISEQGRRVTAMNGTVRWHAFAVIARKPRAATPAARRTGYASICMPPNRSLKPTRRLGNPGAVAP